MFAGAYDLPRRAAPAREETTVDSLTSFSADLSVNGSGDWSVPLVQIFYQVVTALAPDLF